VNSGLPGQLMYFAYISEVLAPVLILLGIYTRISILAVIVTMLTVFYVLPFPVGLDEHGALTIESQIFFTLVPLALFFTGPGRYRLMQNKSGNWLLD
jgi:putative oxidoreductase